MRRHVLPLTSAPCLVEGSQVWDKQHCAEELGGDQLSRASLSRPPGSIPRSLCSRSAVGSCVMVTVQCQQKKGTAKHGTFP